MPRAKDAKDATVQLTQVVSQSFDSVSEMNLAEINQQAESLSTETKLSEHLLRVHGRERFHGFQFDYDGVIYEQIESESFVKNRVVVANRNRDLSSYIKASLGEIVSQNSFVNGFQQSRAQLGVDSKRSVEHGSSDFIFVHNYGFRRLAANSSSKPLRPSRPLREAILSCRFLN